MKYDSEQLSKEIDAMTINKEGALKSYHHICGAIEMLKAMHKIVLAAEVETKMAEEAKKELDPAYQAASMDAVESTDSVF